MDVSEQQSTRLLCRDTVNTEMARQFASQHWFLWNRIERDDNQPLVYEWSTATKDCRIRFTDDHRLGLRWFDLVGPRAADVAVLIKSAFPIHERDEVIAGASAVADENQGIWAAFKLAVIANGTAFDADLFGAFGDLANHRFARVRDAAIYAMAQAGWSQFAGILEPIAEDDPDEGVRQRAAQVLKNVSG
jgi:HEAT repeats